MMLTFAIACLLVGGLIVESLGIIFGVLVLGVVALLIWLVAFVASAVLS